TRDSDVGGSGERPTPKSSVLQVARGRAKERLGVPFTSANTVLIGDSTRDVQAARIGGAAMVGVASGRPTAAERREAGADVVLPDLSNAAEVVAAVAALTGPPGRKAG